MVIVRANKAKKYSPRRAGFALLVVLFVVMAITVLSLGYLARCNAELTAGSNMLMRTELDHLVASGFEQAKTLIVNGYDVPGTFWTGATAQQLTPGSDYYYDVSLSQLTAPPTATPFCGYVVRSTAYRLKNGERVGICDANAILRFDPAIACWMGSSAAVSLPNKVSIYGDVYCASSLTSANKIYGDIYASSYTGTRQGQLYPTMPVAYPNILISHLVPDYYYYDSGSKAIAYGGSVDTVTDINDAKFTTSGPIYYCNGPTTIKSNAAINGSLIVNGDLTVQNAVVTITAMKNFPAMVVNGQLKINSNTTLAATGLTQVNHIDANSTNATANFTGAVFIKTGYVFAPSTATVTITASPIISQIAYWPDGSSSFRFTPAPTAFYKNIKRIAQ